MFEKNNEEIYHNLNPTGFFAPFKKNPKKYKLFLLLLLFICNIFVFNFFFL